MFRMFTPSYRVSLPRQACIPCLAFELGGFARFKFFSRFFHSVFRDNFYTKRTLPPRRSLRPALPPQFPHFVRDRRDGTSLCASNLRILASSDLRGLEVGARSPLGLLTGRGARARPSEFPRHPKNSFLYKILTAGAGLSPLGNTPSAPQFRSQNQGAS